MLYYCSRMCRPIIFPHFFDSLYWGMLIYFPSWILLDIVHSYLMCCEDCICCFHFSRFGHSYLRLFKQFNLVGMKVKWFQVLLYITIISHLFAHSSIITQFYFKQFNSAYVNKIKWFQVFLCITNNSIKHQSLVQTQLNDQTVIKSFWTSQFNISHLFSLSLNDKQFYLIHRQEPFRCY